MMRPFAPLRRLLALWTLLRPRSALGTAYVPLVFLPDSVSKALEAHGAFVEPYAELAKGWHEHALSFAADYGSYARSLIEDGQIKSGSALDLACGTGVTTLALAPLFRVVRGLDASEAMLTQARRHLGHLANVEFVRGDFRTFTAEQGFDLVTCSGDSLNYAANQAELASAFCCVARALTGGGIFVFDLQSPAPVSRRFAVRVTGPGRTWYQVFAFDRATGVDDSVVVTAAGVEPHRRRIFTSEEVAAAAAAAGLVAADQLHRGLLRYLSRGGGRDFYALKRAAP
jgi:SAM-dependent methyltransferase